MQTREQINADWRIGETRTDTNIRNILEVLFDIRDVICGKLLEVDTPEKCCEHYRENSNDKLVCLCADRCHHKKEEGIN